MNLGHYFEIPATDLPRAVQFYASVFHVTFLMTKLEDNEMALFPLEEGQPGITGALVKGPTYTPSKSGSLIYLKSDSIDETLTKVIAHHGHVLFPKTAVETYGFVAEFEDSEGNRVGLFEQSVSS